MPVQMSKSQPGRGKGAAPSIQPWQLVVLILALLLVGWQAISYVAARRAAANITHTDEQERKQDAAKYPVGSMQYQRQLDK